MSGGYFYSSPYQLIMLAEKLDEFIKSQTAQRSSKDITKSYNFSNDTLSKIQDTIDLLNNTYNKLKKVDYLLSSDISEETFNNDW
jgi:hypothetical protein